jgi:hypothetical protein
LLPPLVCILLALVLCLWAQSRRGPSPSEADKRVLSNLAIYKARYEVDDRGRVVRLILEGKQVTDQALDEVHALPHLNRLSLHNSSITDAGLLKLRVLKRLHSLGVTNTQVTDRGLAYLQQKPCLRHVWVSLNDKLTLRGIASLQRALPALKIHVVNRPRTANLRQRGKAAGGKAPPDREGAVLRTPNVRMPVVGAQPLPDSSQEGSYVSHT